MNATSPQRVQQIGWEWNTIRQRFGPSMEEEDELFQELLHQPTQDTGLVSAAHPQRPSTLTTGEAYLARLTDGA